MNFARYSEHRSPVPDPPAKRRKPASVEQIKEWIRLHLEMMGGMGDASSYGKLDRLKLDLRNAQARARRLKRLERSDALLTTLKSEL